MIRDEYEALPWTRIRSTTIQRVAWRWDQDGTIADGRDDKGTLWVEFTTRHGYQYEDVERHVWEALLDAPSSGRYFHERIRGRYPYTHIQFQEAA